jgi:tetratricopeptide (TPR) repeat protein
MWPVPGSDSFVNAPSKAARLQFAMALEQGSWIATRVDAAWADAYVNRAKTRINEKKWREALAFLSKALELDASRKAELFRLLAAAHNQIAWQLFLLGKSAEGLADAEAAVSFSPDDGGILDTRGQIYLVLGRVNEAFADFDKAIAKGLQAPETFYGRGRSYELIGQKELAIADYRKALTLRANNDDARSAQSLAKERLAILEAETRSGPPKN